MSSVGAVAGLLASAEPPPGFSWDLVGDLREMLAYPFMVNAFRGDLKEAARTWMNDALDQTRRD